MNPTNLTRDALESACDELATHYERIMQQGPQERREHAYQAFHIVHEVRMNLTQPRASYVPGRSVQELSRLCVFGRAIAVAFEHSGLAMAWELLSYAMAASIGPQSFEHLGVRMADATSV